MEVLRSQRRPKESGSGEDQRQALYLNLPNNGQKDKILVRETKSEKVCSRNNETKKQLYVPGTGQQTVLSWLVDMGTLQPRERVYYLDHKSKKALLCGDIVGGQILCDCCYLIVSISEFEAHSKSKICDPLKNIYVGGGRSLLQCLAQTWSMQDEYACNFFNLVCLESDDQNDNICCDGCPSTFHERCLDIQTLPTGDWQCCPCKFCVKQKDSSEGFHQSMNNACRICGQRYHQSCLKSIGANTAHSKQEFLCGNSCKELYERLEKLLGVKYQTEDGFSWSFICRTDFDSNASQLEPRMVECNSKLGVALSIMNECFLPCIVNKSRINLMRSVIYNCGSNISRLDFKRFVTAILQRYDEIISVASIRIHGNQLAEMPYIGTRSIYRRQGMCSKLLSSIELALSFLEVELLVIPVVSTVKNTWIDAFGFEPLDLRSKTIIKGMNLLVFPNTEILQKKIPKRYFSINFTPTQGMFNLV